MVNDLFTDFIGHQNLILIEQSLKQDVVKSLGFDEPHYVNFLVDRFHAFLDDFSYVESFLFRFARVQNSPVQCKPRNFLPRREVILHCFNEVLILVCF